MIDRFGVPICINDRIVCCPTTGSRIGLVFGTVDTVRDHIIGIICDDDSPYRRIGQSPDRVVILNESDPRVTRFILENSV